MSPIEIVAIAWAKAAMKRDALRLGAIPWNSEMAEDICITEMRARVKLQAACARRISSQAVKARKGKSR